ncbi:MAG: hypothetical protein JETT_0661 [Candidatus Jettenia ecosi]|uniref:Uncharacterized protein n=1 Tax=Candidatus Jettenia ecosi TaxID=2494326 RepID=A0A533QE39_9BACT|nr:MAG: hypothetical protein JETT_0661 [Candidatus Jettenia ecosi]
MGVSAGTVHQWMHQYKHKGPDAFILQGRGGRVGGDYYRGMKRKNYWKS